MTTFVQSQVFNSSSKKKKVDLRPDEIFIHFINPFFLVHFTSRSHEIRFININANLITRNNNLKVHSMINLYKTRQDFKRMSRIFYFFLEKKVGFSLNQPK